MPEIQWNGQIKSVRSLQYLAKVRILNYKEVYAKKNDDSSSEDENEATARVMKIELHWYKESYYGNYGPVYDDDDLKVKTYYMEKATLEHFINCLKVELNKWKVNDVACELL